MRTLLVLCVALAACSSSDKKTDEQAPTAAEPPPTTAAEPSPTTAGPGPAAATPPASGDRTAALLAELASAARCSEPTSPFRPWCIAATGWNGAIAAPFPTGPAVLVGLTIELEDGASTADALTNRVSFSALAVRADGDRPLAKIIMIKPENPEENQMVGEAVFATSAVFKGMASAADIPANLRSYLSSLPATADYPVRKGDHGWSWSGASKAELRKAGDHWVAIERPSQGASGIFVSIFTDKLSD